MPEKKTSKIVKELNALAGTAVFVAMTYGFKITANVYAAFRFVFPKRPEKTEGGK